MIRFLLIAAVLSALAFVGAGRIGQALDHEAEQHIVFTRNGITLDCERITDVVGNTFYDSCVRVP